MFLFLLFLKKNKHPEWNYADMTIANVYSMPCAWQPPQLATTKRCAMRCDAMRCDTTRQGLWSAIRSSYLKSECKVATTPTAVCFMDFIVSVATKVGAPFGMVLQPQLYDPPYSAPRSSRPTITRRWRWWNTRDLSTACSSTSARRWSPDWWRRPSRRLLTLWSRSWWTTLEDGGMM